MCADAPDTGGMNQAALDSAKISKEALDWYKQIYAEQAPDRAAAADRAQAISDAQLEALSFATQQARDLDAYNRTTFRPLEQGIVADANNYDTAERRQAASDAAIADVNKGFSSTREATMRRLAAEGIEPGSARAIAILGDGAVDQATAQAGAAYRARQGVEQQGYARRMDAASLGRNIASAQATQQQIATQAGNSSAANAGNALSATTSGNGLMGEGFNTALRGTGQAGDLYGQIAQINAASNNDGLWGAVGNVAGQFAGSQEGSLLLARAFSDANLKTDIEPADDDEALEEVEATPGYTWKYDPAKMAARGIAMSEDMESEQEGPMAQDVAKTMGPEASDGTKVSLVSMNGKAMGAIRAVNKKVDQLAAQVSSIASMLRRGRLQAGAA